jgi:hypothetical protein
MVVVSTLSRVYVHEGNTQTRECLCDTHDKKGVNSEAVSMKLSVRVHNYEECLQVGCNIKSQLIGLAARADKS